MAEQMSAVLRVAAHVLRTRWRGWVLLALLVAVGGGAVLTAAAGARRTDTAYPRLLQASEASDVVVAPARSGLGGYFRALAQLPGAAVVAAGIGLNVQPAGAAAGGGAVAEVAADGRLWHRVDIPKLLAGRLPRAGRASEIAIDQNGAARLHLRVGSTLRLVPLPNAPPGAPGSGDGIGKLTEHVVGIVVTRSSVDPVTDNDKLPLILATPALWHRLGSNYLAFEAAYVRLRPGATAGEFGRRAQALARRFPGTGGQIAVVDAGVQAATVERLIRPEAISLAFFALVLALTVLLIVGQAAVRQLAAASADTPVLAALGMTRAQLMAAGLIGVGVAAAAGAVAAAGVAVAASPLMPIGTARLAEPDPGVSIDWTVLVPGAVAIVGLLVASVARPAWRFTAPRTAGPGVERVRRATRARPAWGDAPVTAILGTRFALGRGGGRTGGPVRGALAGTTLAVLAVTAAFTFGASLVQLVHSPSRYGQRWGAAIDLQFSGITPAQATRLIGREPGVSGWSFGDHGTVSIHGAVVPAIGLTPARGPLLSPTLLQGRSPRTGHEIALGTSTLRTLGLHLGQPVKVEANGRTYPMRIVGQAVFPNFGQGGFTPTDLGEGAETTAAVMQPQAQALGAGSGFQVVLVRFRAGQGLAADLAGFRRAMAGFCRTVQQSTCVVTDQRPNGVADYARIEGIPQVLALLLAVLGVAVLGQAMVVSGWRQRRDFATLKALGLVPWQVQATVAWQATILTALALLAGLPLGVAAGRWAWALFSGGLGVPPGALVPVPFVLLMVPAAILAANAVAFWPAGTAARLRPAQVLRAE
jgi:putative ABC transport system permease protein